MDKVTLKNQHYFNEIRGELTPESLSDIISNNKLAISLTDSGINSFKEIENFNNISFGHFILLEKILGLEMDDIDKKLILAAPIFLRPLDELKLDNEDASREKEHKERVLDEPIGNVIGAFNRLLELRKTYLYKTYNGVIYGVLNDEEDEEEEEGTNINTGISAREFHSKKFFWNSLISDVAQGDIFKFNKVVDLMMYVVMPYLAEKRSLAIVERLEHKASMI